MPAPEPSLPDPTPPRKLSRLGLYIPFGLLALFVAGWSAVWVVSRGQAEAQLDAAAAAWRQAGVQVAWKDRTMGGYPFRLDMTLTDVTVRDLSGWGLDAPRLEGEAFIHAPGHWLIAAPAGASFTRPAGGTVEVRGQLIRASLTHIEQRPPSLSFEGVKLTFAPAAGAQPFGLASADRVEFHLRAGPDDEGGIFARLDGGKAGPTGLFARLAGAKPIAMVWNSTLSKMSAFTGATWPAAVRHWSGAGGRMTVRDAGITAGEAVLGVTSGTLGASSGGRLDGALAVTLRQAPRALTALAAEGLIPPETAQTATAVVQARQGAGDAAQASLDFQAGRVTLGPVALGDAPKVYTP